jgi:hypothetical protein
VSKGKIWNTKKNVSLRKSLRHSAKEREMKNNTFEVLLKDLIKNEGEIGGVTLLELLERLKGSYPKECFCGNDNLACLE